MRTVSRGEGLFVFDAVRAVAALAVLLSHARSLVLLDAADQPRLSLAGRMMFAATGLGHQAVVVFFVVSGALVTRSLLDIHAGRGAPSTFVVSRLCRLLVVLLPCLLLGGLEDAIGLACGPGSAGAAHVAERLTAGTLAGNLLFLQGMLVPVFGSNDPLWTLSVEAWCYVGAFCVFAALRARREPLRATCCIVGFGLATAYVLPWTFWRLVPLWMCGAATAALLPNRPGARPGMGGRGGANEQRAASFASRLPLIALPVLGCAVLAARSLGDTRQAAADYALALIAAAVLAASARWSPRPGVAVRVLRRMANLSYSLYLSHYPALALCAGLILGGGRLALGPGGLALAAALALLALAQAVLVWAVFERRTAAVRDAILDAMRPRPTTLDLRRQRSVAS